MSAKGEWFAVGPEDAYARRTDTDSPPDEEGYTYDAERDERIWTVSPQAGKAGWSTDGGTSGYGLTKKEAEYLAECTGIRERGQEAVREWIKTDAQLGMCRKHIQNLEQERYKYRTWIRKLESRIDCIDDTMVTMMKDKDLAHMIAPVQQPPPRPATPIPPRPVLTTTKPPR